MNTQDQIYKRWKLINNKNSEDIESFIKLERENAINKIKNFNDLRHRGKKSQGLENEIRKLSIESKFLKFYYQIMNWEIK